MSTSGQFHVEFRPVLCPFQISFMLISVQFRVNFWPVSGHFQVPPALRGAQMCAGQWLAWAEGPGPRAGCRAGGWGVPPLSPKSLLSPGQRVGGQVLRGAQVSGLPSVLPVYLPPSTAAAEQTLCPRGVKGKHL